MELNLKINITWNRVIVACLIIALLFASYTAGKTLQSREDSKSFLDGQTKGYIDGKSQVPLSASGGYNTDYFSAGYLVGYMYGYPFPALGELKTTGVQPRIIFMDFGVVAQAAQPAEQNVTTNGTG